MSHRGIHRVITPAGLPPEWTARGWTPAVDTGTATPRELDTIPAVVTGSAVAISETGTIVLDGGARCGPPRDHPGPRHPRLRRRDRDIVQTVPEALRRLDPTRPLTLISGPSATSDIELSRVEGVHGPRTLVVVLAG